MNGGYGNDQLFGADPATGTAFGDILIGGPGDDRLEGGRGQDQFFGNEGNDYFVWVAGDGSDLMEGGEGDADIMQFVANDGANRLELLGGRKLWRDSEPSSSDLRCRHVAECCQIDLRFEFSGCRYGDRSSSTWETWNSLTSLRKVGGDAISINNQVSSTAFTPGGDPIQIGTSLEHTSLRGVNIDLGGDGAADFIEVHGELVEDNIDATLQAGAVDVAGFGL